MVTEHYLSNKKYCWPVRKFQHVLSPLQSYPWNPSVACFWALHGMSIRAYTNELWRHWADPPLYHSDSIWTEGVHDIDHGDQHYRSLGLFCVAIICDLVTKWHTDISRWEISLITSPPNISWHKLAIELCVCSYHTSNCKGRTAMWIWGQEHEGVGTSMLLGAIMMANSHRPQ